MAAADEQYMHRALYLANRGRGMVSPNPMVGCVIARGGKVIAEGWHRRCGGDHAEIAALKRIGLKARGATLYVNLEPCHHYGKTPPCVDVVIRSGVKRAVIAMPDPNNRTCGKSIRKLRRAGIKVNVGICKTEARALNRAFIKHVTTGIPYVIAKVAMSLDGKIAKRQGRRSWITGHASRRYVHALRAEVDAIIVGADTVRIDDPLLNVRHGARHKSSRQALRVVLDSALRTRPGSRLFHAAGGSVVIFASWTASNAREMILTAHGARVVRVKSASYGLDIGAVLKALGGMGVTSVLVEGGAKIFTSFREAGLADEWRFLIAPRRIGDSGTAAFADGLVWSQWRVLVKRRIGADTLVVATST